MEPNKTEKIIKSRLESREIQPSENAWDRLDAMLSVEEKPKKKVFYWKYIAASIVLFLGMLFWYNQTSEVENSIENQPADTIVIEEAIEPKENPIIENQVQEEIVENRKPQTQPSSKTKFKNQIQKSNSKNNFQPEFVAKTEHITYNSQHTTHNEQQTINNKPQTANNKYISAEKLLASVENKDLENSSIQNETIEKPTKSLVKVNPDMLLSVVEEEINQEYRETTFDKIKRKFNETKTAVVNRNYE